jgi:peptidoglycan hydrolase-like protein with peptidoglycan-binding domain
VNPVEPAEAPARRHRGGRRLLAAGAVLVVLVATGAVVEQVRPGGVSLAHPLGVRPSDGGPVDNGAPTATTAVARRSLAARLSIGGTLGYAGDYAVLGQGHGTLTWLPVVGQVIAQGGVLYGVDGAPVVLLYGGTPVYRAFAPGMTAGGDVRQLNKALVSLGYAGDTGLDPTSDEYDWATRAAVERLQKRLGVQQTGRLDLGQLVFLPGALRVTSVPGSLGGQVGGPVLKATSTTRLVSVDLNAAQQSQVKVGDAVTITLPDNQTVPGRISSVGTVAATASGGTSPTVRVEVTPTSTAKTGSLDQAPVQVSVTTATVADALVVPVNALLALAGGGYAVEVVGGDGRHRLVPVTLGLFDDEAGLVQVTGGGLAAGQRVVVPAS